MRIDKMDQWMAAGLLQTNLGKLLDFFLSVAGSVVASVYSLRKQGKDKIHVSMVGVLSFVVLILLFSSLLSAVDTPSPSTPAPVVQNQFTVTTPVTVTGNNVSTSSGNTVRSENSSRIEQPVSERRIQASLIPTTPVDRAEREAQSSTPAEAIPEGLQNLLATTDARSAAASEYWANLQRQVEAGGHDLRPEIKVQLYSIRSATARCDTAFAAHLWQQTRDCVRETNENLDKLDLYR